MQPVEPLERAVLYISVVPGNIPRRLTPYAIALSLQDIRLRLRLVLAGLDFCIRHPNTTTYHFLL